MKLLELIDLDEDPFYGKPVRRFWFNAPTGEEIAVPQGMHHTRYVVRNPKVFGLSSKQVNIIYSKDEHYSDEIVALAFNNHWVRVAVGLRNEFVYLHSASLHDSYVAAKNYVDDSTEELTLGILGKFDRRLEGPRIVKFLKSGKLPD